MKMKYLRITGIGEWLLGTGLHRSGGGDASVARPDQATSRVVEHLGLRVEQFVFEGGELLVSQGELELEGAIGHAAPLAQQDDHLIHDRDKVHPGPSLPGAL